jgi:phospholipase C
MLLVRAGLVAIGLAPVPMAVAHDGMIEAGRHPGAEIQRFVANTVEQERSAAGRKLALLREKVKYVFILFQENRSFDHLLGSFPGARALLAATRVDARLHADADRAGRQAGCGRTVPHRPGAARLGSGRRRPRL